MSLGDWIALARQVAGHSAGVRAVDSGWLIEQGVSEFMGLESLTMWLHDPEWRGFMARTGAAAALVFLELNGIGLPASADLEIHQALIAVAKKTLDKDGLARSLRNLADKGN
jgi:hypothetical protein